MKKLAQILQAEGLVKEASSTVMLDMNQETGDPKILIRAPWINQIYGMLRARKKVEVSSEGDWVVLEFSR